MLQHPFSSEVKTYPIYQVDAFHERLFAGNPAAVCVLHDWLPEHIMQTIAAENNLAETAFCVRNGYFYDIRWFTPTVEVELCGHATLATAHVLWHHEGLKEEQIIFRSKSGELRVRREKQAENLYTLDFPQDIPQTLAEVPELLIQGLNGVPALEILRGKTDYLVCIESEKQLLELNPNLALWAQLAEARGVIVTAPGQSVDFVSRCFFPQSGIDEDPVTGSAHTTLTPYWSKKLGKTSLQARQLSKRQGNLFCQWKGERIELTGYARTYLIGHIFIA